MAGSLADLADLVGGRLIGDGSTSIQDAEVIAAAGPADITLADGPEHAEALGQSSAAAAVVSDPAELGEKPGIVVGDVHAAFGKIVSHLRPSIACHSRGVSPEACVNPSADLAEDVVVHSGASIGAGVKIGPGSTIHSGVRIAAGCVIGEGVSVFPNAVLYENTQVGDHSILHAGVVLGAYGFGYRSDDHGHELSQQLGYVRIGSDVEIGANATIDRGTYGATSIGDGTKIDNLVQIGHNCRIGRHNLICSQVGIAGSTSTGDFVVMAGQVGVRDHVHIGAGAVLSAMAGVPNDVPAGEVMLGAPATPIRDQKLQMAAVAKLPEMRKQFRQMQRQLAALQEELADRGGSEEKAA